MARIWQDVEYAARLLQRAPLFSVVVSATLALTIGATTAVFTVVNAVLLRALPYRDPTRLVLLQQAIGEMAAAFRRPIISRSRRGRACSNRSPPFATASTSCPASNRRNG
jgi:hypothetical protein